MPNDLNEFWFYTNATLISDTMYLRGVDREGSRFMTKYTPDFSVYFQLTGNVPDSGFKTLENERLAEKHFSSKKEMKNFVDQYRYTNFKLYYNHRHQYDAINRAFPEKIEADPSKIKIGFIDIEVESEAGYAKPENPTERINAICYTLGDNFHVFGLEPFDSSNLVHKNKEVLKYYQCSTEEELLQTFINVWASEYPDIITHWYGDGFDLPYITKRCEMLLGETKTKKLSPWGRINYKEVKNEFDENQMDLRVEYVGISSVDYMDIYKKFILTKRESYSLSFIGEVEKLEERKITYEDYTSLRHLYKTNWQKFIEYNIGDVKTLRCLDRKLKLLDLTIHVAYTAKVNYSDVLSMQRIWECMIMNEMYTRKIIPYQDGVKHTKETKIGAYVKDAQPGMIDWTVSIDLDSLYPSLIRMLNISPETILPGSVSQMIDIDQFVKDKKLPWKEDEIFALNQSRFKREKGFIPQMVETMYADRKKYKKLQLESANQLESVKAELKRRGLSNE